METSDPRALDALLERSRSVRAESVRIAARYAEIREHIGLERRRSLTRTTEAIDRENAVHPVMLTRLDRLSRRVGRSAEIEQAKSLLADRYGISRGEAFSILRTVSSRSNRKLRDVAAAVLGEEAGGRVLTSRGPGRTACPPRRRAPPPSRFGRADGLAEEGRICVHYLGHVRVVALVGEHDLSTVDALSDEIERQFRTAPHVVVDLTRATFVDSTVVCALALGGEHARARSACRFAVVAAPDSFVHKVFDMVDLRNMMPTYETLEEALADGGVIRGQTARLRPV